MILFAESSAILAWLLGEPRGAEVVDALEAAEHVIVSDLLFVECARNLIRGAMLGRITDQELASRRQLLAQASANWQTQRVAVAILNRSKQPFPREPVRSIDALHLASALHVASALPGLRMLSLDRRVRENAAELGFEVVPADT